MRGANGYAFHGRGLYPTADSPAAGKDQRIHAIALDDRKLEIAIVGSRLYFFPNWPVIHRSVNLSAARVARPRRGFSRGLLFDRLP